MDTKESGKYYKYKLLFSNIRHGLFLHMLQNFMSRLGLDFAPYYWVQEDFNAYKSPQINDDKEKYTISFLSDEEVKSMKRGSIRKFKGTKLIGLKHNNQIAAFHCAEQRDFVFKGKKMKLKKNEAYLLNMYTFQNYRGKNLAPYLRHATYDLLKEEGVDTFYSISDYLNKSTHKFKKKLGAEPLQLYLSIALLKKYHRTFLLKTYK
ncbi:GNAT family N-acetyltransferase [Flagellimonas algicola]|uniref:GNAT family N-acetyltransferase n=1 Tax=Flagellimonas algicola TaxID=2583815 RepID=A0ABY2WNY2_9FLAO|nr:GNAT family N-acetyltransferase [Allomuricauda algicola]TMU56699.1 GNAT family N-acetyltransferase [Allomuricauda algicola]